MGYKIAMERCSVLSTYVSNDCIYSSWGRRNCSKLKSIKQIFSLHVMGIRSLPFNCRGLCCIDLLWNNILVNTVFIKTCAYTFYEQIRNYPNDYLDSWYAIYGRRHALGWLVWCTTTNFV